MYVVAQHLGAKSAGSRRRASTVLRLSQIDAQDPLFEGLEGQEHRVWMSHGDRVESIPPTLRSIAHTANAPYAAVRTDDGRIRGIQFHPEVVHTPCGAQVLRNFVLQICGEPGDWTMANFIETKVAEIRETVGARDKVLLALSGGVDSSVAAALIHRAIGERLKCVFVDTGLLRAGERERMENVFAGQLGIDLTVTDASELFLKRLKDVLDPEQKRRIIGHTFIDVFESEDRAARRAIPGAGHPLSRRHRIGLVQRPVGRHQEPSQCRRTAGPHEARTDRAAARAVQRRSARAGTQAGAAARESSIASRFPARAWRCRIVGEVTRDRVELLRRADLIVMEEFASSGIGRNLWQAFAVLLPLKTVGVMGDGRSYESVIAIRAVESQDGMTADWARLDPGFLARVSSRITNEIRGVNRVVYDITSKPPATIEWE